MLFSAWLPPNIAASQAGARTGTAAERPGALPPGYILSRSFPPRRGGTVCAATAFVLFMGQGLLASKKWRIHFFEFCKGLRARFNPHLPLEKCKK